MQLLIMNVLKNIHTGNAIGLQYCHLLYGL